jgi:uncharacterized protein (TIGR02246 family)
VTTLSRPEQVIEQFAERMTGGDVEGALALYEPEATFAPQPGEEVRGLDAIRAALGQFAALRPTLSGRIDKVLEAGDTALVVNAWTLEGTAPDGAPVTMAGRSADVLRRQGDGTWRVVIDDPWGGAA